MGLDSLPERGRTSRHMTPSTQPTPSVIQSPIAPEPEPEPQTSQAARQRIHRLRPKRANPPELSATSTYQLERRPYQTAADRRLIAQGARHHLTIELEENTEWPVVYHVDLTSDELSRMVTEVSKYLPLKPADTLESLRELCQQYHIPTILGGGFIRGRTVEDLCNFCSDVLAGEAAIGDKSRILSFEQECVNNDVIRDGRRKSRMASLLLARELEGNHGFGRMRTYENFQNEFRKLHEDGLSLIAEFTNCAGDIATISWVLDGNFICGTTAHSDSHNQQYNKPGNLLLCSTKLGELRAFADHRITRPLVEKGENSTEAMRQSQDPWLYSSVVSSDYDVAYNRAYTASFDKTVKVWQIDNNGKRLACLATWLHQGNVNFVAAAKDGSGWVASAADVPYDAVRIYTVDSNNVQDSPYQAISCTRTDAEASGKWAYYPATMQWGQVYGAQHLLAVGYSPRSFTNDDQDIPEDKLNSGEIMLWDAAQCRRVPVLTASTANVFEIAWHPKLARFIAATSPCGLSVEHGVRTQIHVFQRDLGRHDGAYHEYQILNCYASDINELTFMPNSPIHAYVTAACTDGNVYVWDTAQGDTPIHILKHGHPLDEYYHDREREDTGAKFTAWGTSLDRLYTGASDGVVKVWNVRNLRKPHVRDLLEAPGPISCGAFSPDHSKLAVGDATGRVFIFSLDKRDELEAHFTTLPGLDRKIRRPIPFTPHPEPPSPEDCDLYDMDGENCELHIADQAHQTYIDTQQLVLDPNPIIGAVQGPEYASTGLYCREAHLDHNPAGPLLTAYERNQLESIRSSRGGRTRSARRLQHPGLPSSEWVRLHNINKARDLNVEELAEDEIVGLIQASQELSLDDEDWGFSYEEMPF